MLTIRTSTATKSDKKKKKAGGTDAGWSTHTLRGGKLRKYH